MVRQGKYTKRVTPVRRAKREARRGFRWWREMSWKKRILVISAPIVAFLVLMPLATYLYFARDIANQERLMNRNNTGVVLYASDGTTEIYSLGRAKHRDMVKLDAISDSTEQALLSSEDKDFYNHGGFSIISMMGALYANIATGGKNYGGSTLTQQLAKITLLSDQKSYLRKFQELSVSIAIERTYTKDEILEMYLNSAFFGGNVFGIEDAARTYFGKAPADLTLGESAMLIGILPAPNAYSPLYGNIEYALERQNTVLSRMLDNGVITAEQKESALAETLPLQEAAALADDSRAPHYTEMVMNDLYKRFGEEAVIRSGYRVTTTLDMNVQQKLQAAVTGNMATITRNNGSNASAVAIDPTTGGIRGLVGSYDWKDETFGKVNMVTTPRQPGSSIKPLYYAQALADGDITAATILEDKKTDFGDWTPQNADRRFRGNVTVRNALNWSLNIPAVQVMQKVGLSDSIETAKRLGISAYDKPSRDIDATFALGSVEAPLLQMTNAYAAFANEGEQYPTTVVSNVQSKFGDKVFAENPTAKEVMSEGGSFLISNILSDNASRASVFGNSLTVYDSTSGATKKVAVKTGTTDESRDAWAIGYTPQLAVGVWVGNNDNTPMANGGSIMAGPIFTKSMGAILAGVPTDFPSVPGVVQRAVCADGSLANTEVKGKTRNEFFLSTALPTKSCSVAVEESEDEKKKEEEPEVEEAVATTASLTTSPSSGASAGGVVTLTVTVSPAASGTATFYDGGTALGTVPVTNGRATLTVTSLEVGTRLLSVRFEPRDTAAYEASTSATVSYTITDTATTPGGTTPGTGSGDNGRQPRIPGTRQ